MNTRVSLSHSLLVTKVRASAMNKFFRFPIVKLWSHGRR